MYLKLHATVMNARHRKRKTRTKRSDSFDARGIVRQHGSEEWGEYLIREAHLSQRFVFDDNGYYHCCASIPFPENMQIE
ncbi:activating signal cointegrator 1 complex subunit 1-like [Macadamia integrifolia]|uniref:activating signal cointegrator 1 complex subunit 1-like n=1 Tax=Macadamia integrifolia TaxID=60698 RepID=UPI001C4F0525|nr:activating signal cointegrator 1 complex subunit 1-like [Macadamia integrifolia]